MSLPIVVADQRMRQRELIGKRQMKAKKLLE
jgi:hypothetical protein